MPAKPATLHSTHLFAVRDNLDLAEKKAHRTVAFLALDDIVSRARLRHQWAHPHMARLLGVSQPFTAMLGNYLEYRRQHIVGAGRGIRPHGASAAQLFLYDENQTPLDLINLGTGGDRTEQMAALLMQASYRKVQVDPEAAHTIEGMLGRACGMAWETITSTSQRQRAAQYNSTTTTAMGVRAA